MSENPWHVESIQDFAFLNCPECAFKTKEEGYFQDHAISSHPNCFVLFGHTEIVVQEVTIGDPKREYYIEVKANAVPTKEELAHALASIEEPMEEMKGTHQIEMQEEHVIDTLNNENTEPETKVIIGLQDHPVKVNIKGNFDDTLNDPDYEEEKPKVTKKSLKKLSGKNKTLGAMLDDLGGTWQCYFCDKEFEKRKFLDLHRRRKHMDARGHFPCRYCEKTAPSFLKIKTHIKDSHTPGYCEECNKTFKNNDSYRRHRKTVHIDQSIKKYKCEFCSYEVHAKRYLTEHVKKEHPNQHDEYLERTTPQHILKRIVKKRQSEPTPDENRFFCDRCKGSFQYRGSIRNHVCDPNIKKKSDQKFQCPFGRSEHVGAPKCDWVSKQGGFIMHYKKEHGDFPAGFEGMEVLQCDVCPAQFIKAKALKNHKQRTHDIGLPEVLACDRCDAHDDYRTPTYLIKHYREAHNGMFPPMFENKAKFICNECPNIYLLEVELKRHIHFSHTGKYNYNKKGMVPVRQVCKWCGKTYSVKERLKDHIIMEHEESAQYQCEVCHRKQPSAIKLRHHIIDVHTKVTCDLCNEVLYNIHYMKKHKAQVHGIIPHNSHKCQLCPMIYRSEGALKKHMVSKH